MLLAVVGDDADDDDDLVASNGMRLKGFYIYGMDGRATCSSRQKAGQLLALCGHRQRPRADVGSHWRAPSRRSLMDGLMKSGSDMSPKYLEVSKYHS